METVVERPAALDVHKVRRGMLNDSEVLAGRIANAVALKETRRLSARSRHLA
jgi:hypothetical protein